MKSRHFALSPMLYALIAVGLAAELFLFFPNSYRVYAAKPTLDNLPLLAADGAVLLVLALVMTAVISISRGAVILRVCGVPLSKTPIDGITSVLPSFPFLSLQRGSGGAGKPRFCPAVAGQQRFIDALREENPNIRLETPGKKGL